MKSIIMARLILPVIFFLTTGCLSWEPGWKQAAQPAVKGDVKALMERAKKLESGADSKAKVEGLIAAFEDVVKADPQNLDALSSLGGYWFLTGTAYAGTGLEKAEALRKAVGFCERAMYTNPGFRDLADRGEPAWKACRALSVHEMEAMYYWYLSMAATWSGLVPEWRVLNTHWMARGRRMLEHMERVAPAWRSGCVHCALALHYSITPEFAGGSISIAADYFCRAIDEGPRMTCFRACRAEYLFTRLGDKAAFIDELNIALAADPGRAGALKYPWAVWHRENARKMLARVDEYFGK